MTRSTARRLATDWQFWLGLLMIAVVVSTLVGLLPGSLNLIIIPVVLVDSLYRRYGKTPRTKLGR